jgi:hypothetical protein
MHKLTRLENKYHISLPEIYRDFYSLCSHSLPANLVGTSLCNDADFDMKEAALELIEECNIENFLQKDDFVFMMHQGYMFWYFKANGDPDPVVFGYYEGKPGPDNFGKFSEFVKEYSAS